MTFWAAKARPGGLIQVNPSDKDIITLSKLNVDKYVRKASGACEENVKIKIVIPLLNLLGYSTEADMDFEHHVQNKRADIALLLDGKPSLLVETKDLDAQLDNHVNQGLDYAFNKGIEWVILTNGLEVRLYKSFIAGISNPKDRLLFSTNLVALPELFKSLSELVGKQHFLEGKNLKAKTDSVRENITAQILVEDLAECRDKLFADLLAQFKDRYKTDIQFKETIDVWATTVKMDISDPKLIDKLCREGAYTLINRVLFLRICEDRGHIKPKLSKDSLSKWRDMVEKPSNLLDIAFKEIGERFEGLYKSPLFDSISFDDIDWNSGTINFVLDKLGEQDFSKISKDILGRAYEQHIPSKERKALGQFYTPDFVIDYILDRLSLSPEKAVLDPACGSGGFLVKAYDRLRTLYVGQGWKADIIHENILKTNLFGIDINPFATQLTVMNLLLKDLDRPTGEINVAEGDTLEKLEGKFDFDTYQVESPLKYVTSTDKKVTYARLLKHKPFSIVVGNPPYVSFGTRGTLGSDKEKRGYFKFLRNNYPNSAEYKLSIYAIFLDRSIDLLADSGRLGFVIPDSFLLGQYYRKLRRRILDSCAIEEICIFKKDFWKFGVVGLPVIIILRKEKDLSKRLANTVTVRQGSLESKSGEYVFKTNSYKQKFFEGTHLNRFRLFFSEEARELVESMEHDSVPLVKFVDISSGIRPKDDRTQVVSTSKLGLSWQRGLISSGEVKRYALHYAGNFINIKPELLWSGGWNPTTVNSNKLLLRRTGDSLTATYNDEGIHHLDNIHCVVSKTPDVPLKYILAVLNSEPMNLYYHLISLESGRVMAQLDIETIEQLPIKRSSQESSIVAAVDKILSLNKQLSTINNEDQQKSIQAEIRNLDEDIDAQVCQAYGISKNQMGKVKF